MRELQNISSSSLTPTETVDTSLSDFTTSASSGSTVPGPGALSGKAILALGKATLRGAEYLIIRQRLRFISSKFALSESWFKRSEGMYVDLLELSRVDLYPESVRLQAIRLLVAQIGSRRTRHLINGLSKWPSIEIQLFIFELTSVLDPIRLSSFRGVDNMSEVVNAYQASLATWEDHSLAPFIDFLSQIAQLRAHALEAVLQGGAMDFLLHAYVTCFCDPLSIKCWLYFSPGSVIRKSCDHFLSVLSSSTMGLELLRKHPVRTLWPTGHDLPFTNLVQLWEKERLSAWCSCKEEVVVRRLQSTFSTMMAWTISDESAMYDLCVDLLELAGSEDLGLPISMTALRSLYRLIRGHRAHFQRDVQRYLRSSGPSHFIDIMSQIIRRLHCVSLSISPEAGLFLSPSDTTTFGGWRMLSLISDLLPVAEANNTFLEVILASNILDFLWHFLKMELGGLEIISRDSDQLKISTKDKPLLLAKIGEHGLAPLLPDRPDITIIPTYYRRILCRAFDVFLRRDAPAESDYAVFWMA